MDQEPEQPVMEPGRKDNLDNVGSHDSDLTDCEDLGTNIVITKIGRYELYVCFNCFFMFYRW